MSDSWDDRRKAQEDGYFENLNKQALARLALKKEQPARSSPATGKPMEHITIMGVVADRCLESGGIWLDAGELEQILHAAKGSSASLQDFVGTLPTISPGAVNLGAGNSGAGPVTSGQKSPITGEPMQQEKILGITIERCKSSQGIWLDARELDRLIRSSHQSLASSVAEFFSMVLGRK
jgi:Zn-finger nucleic acid-binding protein